MAAATTPSIVLQFSRPDFASEKLMDRVISEGICKDTISEICHVDAVIPGVDGKAETLVGAHLRDGIQERPYDYEKWGLRIRVTVPCTAEQENAFYAYVRSKIGTTYDAFNILGLALHDGRLHDSTRLICSSFMTLAVDEATHIVRVAKSYWLVSPEELRLCVTAVPGATEQRIGG